MLVNSGGEVVSPGIADSWQRVTSPPVYFKRQVSDVVSAVLCFGARTNLPKPKASAAKLGLRFEKEVLKQLQKAYLSRFTTGVPLSFQEGATKGGFYQRPSTAIPDGLLLSNDRRSLCLIEIKLRHSTDAWFQLNRFYLPILRRAIGSSLLLRTLEICRYYDPGVKLPQGKRVVRELSEAFAPGDSHPVLIWEKA
jgi:hypothetical protein